MNHLPQHRLALQTPLSSSSPEHKAVAVRERHVAVLNLGQNLNGNIWKGYVPSGERCQCPTGLITIQGGHCDVH